MTMLFVLLALLLATVFALPEFRHPLRKFASLAGRKVPPLALSIFVALPLVSKTAEAATITFDTRYTAQNISMGSTSSPMLIDYDKFIGIQ